MSMTSPSAGQATLPKPKPKSPTSTFLLFLSMGLVVFLITPPGQQFRLFMGTLAGYALDPAIGFHQSVPLLTILLASIILVVGTTTIRHFLVDWVNMARVQEAMRAFQKEFSQARKDNNTYKLKKLTEAQPEVMALQADMSTEQMKPMAFTMILVVPIFAWLYVFMAAAAAAGHTSFVVPWDSHWELWRPDVGASGGFVNADFPRHRWYLLGFFPRWIVLYSLFGIPFGQIAQRALKLWEYRHHDLDGDGKTPAQQGSA